jgi:D-alanyl-D-alanine carboxypeptidase/D-alanyl-D-alanine-endopeptidase (penicillin-binding protein 4)
MHDEESDVADAFLDSLSTAGHTGTLADRMRGTAADGRCHAKTGTLTAVSALSGYCFAPGGRLMVFSILNNRVDVDAAHAAQDKMAALIARYRP